MMGNKSSDLSLRQMMVPASYSTGDFPPPLLRAARLVGDTPFVALTSYPEVSYTLHVPPEHYNPDPLRQEQGPHGAGIHERGVPPYDRPKIPLVVVIHGSSRSAAADRDRLAHILPTNHATLAPLFPAGTRVDPNDWDAYKTLRTGASISQTSQSKDVEHTGFEADTILLDMLKEVCTRWPGIDAEKILLVGFSGGGSFALRFALLYPTLVKAVSVGAPTGGSVVGTTEIVKAWPEGLSNVSQIFGKSISWEDVKKIQWQLVVGSEDKSIEGSLQGIHEAAKKELERAKSNGEQPDWDAVQRNLTRDRRKVLEDVQRGLATHGIESQVEVVQGVAHNPDGVSLVVAKFVEHALNRYWEES